MQLHRNEFHAAFSLAINQPWLAPRLEALSSLLYNDCRDQNERNLLIDLIRRIESLDDTRFLGHLRSIIEKIQNEDGFDPRKTLLVALTADSAPDSGQYVLYALKPILQELGISSIHTANKFGYCCKMIKKCPEIAWIILIDEFLGTGNTLVGRVQQIRQGLAETRGNVRISARFVAAQFNGLLHAANSGIDVYAEVMMERGISDSALPVDESISAMQSLEECLSRRYGERDLPSLGYGKAEALYRRDNGNTPNSVFPIFWWAEYEGSRSRATILTRNMQDA